MKRAWKKRKNGKETRNRKDKNKIEFKRVKCIQKGQMKGKNSMRNEYRHNTGGGKIPFSEVKVGKPYDFRSDIYVEPSLHENEASSLKNGSEERRPSDASNKKNRCMDNRRLEPGQTAKAWTAIVHRCTGSARQLHMEDMIDGWCTCGGRSWRRPSGGSLGCYTSPR
jgi:hypothetical protein